MKLRPGMVFLSAIGNLGFIESIDKDPLDTDTWSRIRWETGSTSDILNDDAEIYYQYLPMETEMKLTDMIKDNKKVLFKFYRNGILYYETEDGFLFEVPTSDTNDACFNAEDKAILFMRWIRKQLDRNAIAKSEIDLDD